MTSVRKNEMSALAVPLLSPVKNAEPKILKPQTRNESA